MNANHPLIAGKRAKQLVAAGAILVDVRNPVAYRDHSITLSVNLSLRQISTLQQYPKTTTIIVVGDDSDADTLRSALKYAALYGFTKLYNLGDISNWDK